MKTKRRGSKFCSSRLNAADRRCQPPAFARTQHTDGHAQAARHSLDAARRSSARILLVEDNLTNQDVASRMLQRLGWHADVRANGQDAIRALEAYPYDLVLMDVQMPKMDGYEATRVIRDSQSGVLNHSIPIIATTAHAMTGDAEKCLAAGMSDYISKPIDQNTLSSVVEKWLKRKVHSTAGRSAGESIPERTGLPKASPAASLVFNREAYLERMTGDEELAEEVVAGFVRELPVLLMDLKESIAAGAVDSIGKHAHKIKGAAANVGGEAVRDVALEIEMAAGAGSLAQVARLIPSLEIQAARLSEAMQQWQIHR